MKTMTWIASTLLIVLSACNDSAPAPTTSKVSEKKPLVTENLSANNQTDNVSPRYKNGTNDQNRGDKTGRVTLHGNVKAAEGSRDAPICH